ncbi:metallophosphoesterase family protein [Methanofollis fontis]|uniref:Metallophosphoesterase n=1 Tax=Methanofollis fontis TaxID=2052832 RepID=A0A483CMI4_9EURY|nr:metallophosphoesterase [Methanofollis fontis]TAJ43822.1 metallophosphoesterase [Methanofollis fontis]
MMDVLLLADLHGNLGKLESFMDLQPDFVIIAGDLTQFGPCEMVKTLNSLIDVPCFAVPGNCDPCDICNAIDHSDFVNLHGSAFTLGKISMVGIGGSNPTPFGTPFELPEEEIDRMLQKAIAHMDRNIHNVLVTHAPPYGALDLAGDTHVGSTSVRNHIKAFDLVCCAHMHEHRGVEELDGVRIVNPGPASEGNCAMIHFGDEPGDFTIELLTL